MHCGSQYPDVPPTIQFVSQVNLPCVDSRNGVVDPTMLPCLAQWKRDNTMETVLIELRRYAQSKLFSNYRLCVPKTLTSLRYMAAPGNKKIPQPPEGSTYS